MKTLSFTTRIDDSFAPVGSLTEVKVDCDITADYEQYMITTWPKALAKLKAICESD